MNDRTLGLYWAKYYPSTVAAMAALIRRPNPEKVFTDFAARMPDAVDAQIIEATFEAVL